MSRRAARLIVAARWWVVAAWTAASVAALVLLPSIEQAKSGAIGDLVPANADALKAELRSHELFGFPLLARTIVVERDAGGLSLARQARVVERAATLNAHDYPGLTGVAGALPVTNALGRPPFSRESSTTALTALFFPQDIGRVGQTGLAHRFIERHVDRGPGTFVGVTGAIPARQAQVTRIRDALPFVELATVLLVLVAVGLHARALGAPLVNLVAIAAAYVVSTRVMAGVGELVGVPVPSEIEPVIVVLLFGVVTDYSIFFMTRFRRRLADNFGARFAAVNTLADLLPIIFTAGMLVAAASAALGAAQLGFLQAFGPGMAVAVLVGMTAALTLVPALFAIGGEWLLWPAGTRGSDDETTPGERSPGRRVLGFVSRRPLPVALAAVVLLAAGASGLTGLEVGQTLIRGLPKDAEPYRAYRQAAQGFAPGILSPTVLLVEAPGIQLRKDALERLQAGLEARNGVAEVVGPREQPSGLDLGAVYSRRGDAVRYLIVLDRDPLGGRAIRVIEALRRALPRLLADAGLRGAGFSVAGDTALAAETVRKTRDDLARIAPAALLVVFLILAVFLRSLVAPLYLVVASLLGLAASLGITTYVFQGVLGHAELTFYVPFAAAVLLLALGSDYNVFLTGRIWDEARHRPLREAVVVAGARAARPIAVAGIILAASFALLALVPLRPSVSSPARWGWGCCWTRSSCAPCWCPR